MISTEEAEEFKIDPHADCKNPILPKLSATYIDPSVFSTSPETTRCQAEYLQTEVPHINYLQYRKYHSSKKPKHDRSQSDSPSINFYYIPQVIRVSPRSTVKVFSNFPIIKHHQRANGSKLRGFENRIPISFGNQTKVLPKIFKKIEKPRFELNPALTYGEKLWKLHELASLDLKLK